MRRRSLGRLRISPEIFPPDKLLDKNSGFLVNGEVKVVAEVDILEVIGKSDVLEETSFVIDVNGFQVLPPQVKSVGSLFKSHPDIASRFRPKNPHLRTSYMNVLLGLTEVLCQSLEKLSTADLSDAYSALQYVTQAGFKLDWLEKKLKEAGQNRLQEIEEELKDLKEKCAEMEALVEFLR
ncbi:PREDICTED: MATH domain and coiled-coil domain-containing protein At1g31390-like [Camelina sativa]|uniref:MATH domain and coiled-coil domain-containing protein At1g31390-like n=1 Tax=Camelina sativa TaxID=90675 RepID=A0ABM0TD20_CAMSA|nr:PREDICTED: MATH domain and coiled-coil domain-containing protein At1g31390-like [Camelina sativa]